MTEPKPPENPAWIDADLWLAYLRATGWRINPPDEDPPHPLNFTAAAWLAEILSWPHEHQSDGRTLIRVGVERAKLARKMASRKRPRAEHAMADGTPVELGRRYS